MIVTEVNLHDCREWKWNGELRKQLEIKRAYRWDLASLEEDLRAKYERELADSKKRLKEQYLENVVDTVFAEPAPVKSVL